MAIVTPTASSSFFAGIGLWGVAWSMIYKIEALAGMIGLGSFVNRDRVLDWINANKVVTLILTELVNFGTHGVESSSGVTLALGGTFMNIVMIFVVLPIRAARRRVFGGS